ncbi:hypothetical protein [Blastococcus sp. SYSU D01042]
MVLQLGKAGAHGVGRGVLPVLADGAVVATLQASNWKEQATASIGEREWLFSKRKSEVTARWAVDPDDTARLRARQTSFWKGTWAAELDGTTVEVETLSHWKGTHRYLSGGQEVARSDSTGGWSPQPTLEASPQVPLEHRVFLLWLELVITRRNDAALTAATGAAVVGGSS